MDNLDNIEQAEEAALNEGWAPSQGLEPLTAEQETLLAERKKKLVFNEVIRWAGWLIAAGGIAFSVIDHLWGPVVLITGIVIGLDRGKRCAFLRRKIANPRD